MSVDAKHPEMAAADVETRQDWRRMEVGKAIGMLQELVGSAEQPFNVPGHMLEVIDASADTAEPATYLVVHTFEHSVEKDKEPHKYEERAVISTGRTALIGYSKIDLTEYDATEGQYVALGMQRAEEGLSEDKEREFEAARDKRARLKAERESFPRAELSDADQAQSATNLNVGLFMVHNAVVTHHRTGYPSFARV